MEIKDKITEILAPYDIQKYHPLDRDKTFLIDDLVTLFSELTEPKIVYEKVMCKNELPNESKDYDTSEGLLLYTKNSKWEYNTGRGYYESIDTPKWWLRNITINSLVVPDLSAMYNELGDLYNLTEDRDKELNYGGQIEMLKLFVKLGYATML